MYRTYKDMKVVIFVFIIARCSSADYKSSHESFGLTHRLPTTYTASPRIEEPTNFDKYVLRSVVINEDGEVLYNRKIDERNFFANIRNYWSNAPPTIYVMSELPPDLSAEEIQGSRIFLEQLFRSKTPPNRTYALDCAAGIGRVTKDLLADIFDRVDLLDQNPLFLEEAKSYIGPELAHKIGEYFPLAVQDFQPEENKYDVVWCNWLLEYLTDEYAVDFLKNFKKSLRKNGVIVIKCNVEPCDTTLYSTVTCSVIRPYWWYQKLFSKAGFRCFRNLKQKNIGYNPMPNYIFALRPV